MSEESTSDAWYAETGQEDDVVLSTKVRLARNLANFPFPQKLRGNDGERIQSILFDAFNHLPDGDYFKAVSVGSLDEMGCRILRERGILSAGGGSDTGIIMRTDGKVSCTVNFIDHLRLSVFAAGLDLDGVFSTAYTIDRELQQRVQFAASYDFGYLTSAVTDSGSGIKLSLRLHLPSLSLKDQIKTVSQDLISKGISFSASFGSNGINNILGNVGTGIALGSFYEISSINSQAGTELDQLASIASEVQKLKELERSARLECRKDSLSEVRNYMYRAVALARSSLFISLREAISIISGVKWALDMGLLEGISNSTLHALLYRIQEGHLQFVLKNGDFHFESDIEDNSAKKNERFRALILQEAFANIKDISRSFCF